MHRYVGVGRAAPGELKLFGSGHYGDLLQRRAAVQSSERQVSLSDWDEKVALERADEPELEEEVEKEEGEEGGEEEGEEGEEEEKPAVVQAVAASLKTIRSEQSSSAPVVAFLPWSRLVMEVGQDFKTGLSYEPRFVAQAYVGAGIPVARAYIP